MTDADLLEKEIPFIEASVAELRSLARLDRLHGGLPGSLGLRDDFQGAVTEPAWRTKPSWYLVATDDKMIPPDAQRAMSKRAGATTTQIRGSHAVYVSQPQAVASMIEKAATTSAGGTQ